MYHEVPLGDGKVNSELDALEAGVGVWVWRSVHLGLCLISLKIKWTELLEILTAIPVEATELITRAQVAWCLCVQVTWISLGAATVTT